MLYLNLLTNLHSHDIKPINSAGADRGFGPVIKISAKPSRWSITIGVTIPSGKLANNMLARAITCVPKNKKSNICQ